MEGTSLRPLGYKWRSSKVFIISTISVALFADTFLYGFLIPMLSYMFESRLQVDPSKTQGFTSSILALHGIVSAVSSPVIGHFADKTHNRKGSLLISIVGCILGTVMVAFTHSVIILFLGRILQGIAGSAVWIVGLASIANAVGQHNMGAVMGLAMSFINAGMISGPMVSGLIFEAAGYWLTWSVPLVLLMVNVIMRFVMVENPDFSSESSTKPSDATETTSLLPSGNDLDNLSTTLGFSKLLLSDSRVVTAFLVAFSSACMITSFHATLPFHVQEVFGWGPGRVGMLFFCLSVPGIFIGPVAGWVRDRIGVRIPAAVSLFGQVGILVLIGVAGNDRFSWASSKTTGPVLYTVSIIAIGVMRPFIAGLGPVEVVAVVKEHEERRPGIFGPNGGLSRVFAMSDVALNLGWTIGPILSGILKEVCGYAYMNWALALWCLILGGLALKFLGPQSQESKDVSEV